MVNLDNLTDEQIDALPEGVKEAVIGGRDEIKGARTLIGTLKKGSDNGGDNTPPDDNGAGGNEDDDKPLSNKDLDARLAADRQKDAIDAFLSNNPEMTEERERIEKYKTAGLSFTEITAAIEASPTKNNQKDTNRSGVPGGDDDTPVFSGKVSHDDYKAMSSEEQSSYFESCEKAGYGGVTFSDKFDDQE